MGCFTTIIDRDGRDIQIKVGDDNFETFKIGDKVPYSIGKEPGTGNFLDDVYEGIKTGKSDYPCPHYNDIEKFVIVKNHIIFDVIDCFDDNIDHVKKLYKLSECQLPRS